MLPWKNGRTGIFVQTIKTSGKRPDKTMETVVAEKKVPPGAQKEPFLVAGFIEPFLDFYYGTEDHLGSTRMVLSAQTGGGSEITQALMYQPYGTVSDVQGINTASTDPLRQKFTTKEYELERKQTEIVVRVVAPNLPALFEPVANCKPYMKINFSDGSNNVIELQVDSYGGLFANKETFFDEAKTVSSIELHAEGATTAKSIHYVVNSLNQHADIGKLLFIDLMEVAPGQLMASNPGNYYSFTPADAPELDSKGLFYFGKRYYDAEIGRWMSVDPKLQFFNPYAYHTNPISFVDPTGEDFGLSAVIVGAIIAAWTATLATTANTYQQYEETGNWDWGKYAKDVFFKSNIAGLAGSAGGVVGGAGFVGANTLGLAINSTITSTGNYLYNRNEDISTSFGVLSVNWSALGRGENGLGYLGKRGNSAMQNIGYGMGALANIGDMGKQGAILHTHTDGFGHSAVTDQTYATEVDFGPDEYNGALAKATRIGGIPGASKWYGRVFTAARSTNDFGFGGGIETPIHRVNNTFVKLYGKMLVAFF